jgi:hypothetical protein
VTTNTPSASRSTRSDRPFHHHTEETRVFGKETPVGDLTTPAAVAKSQKVYDRITSGKTANAKAELDKTHGRKK